MSIYYSVIVTRKLVCNCSAYKFHHSVGTGFCSSYEPVDLSAIPLKISPTSLKRARDLVNNEYDVPIVQSSILRKSPLSDVFG